MTSTTFFIIFIPILSFLLLAINLLLAPHNPYQEKDSVFECGFHSFLGQNRTQFSISFFIFGLLFLLFDLEILLVYPYSVSSYTNDVYGLVVMMVFFVLLTLGFIFELGKNALTIDSRQTSSYNNNDTTTVLATVSNVIIRSSTYFIIMLFIICVILLFICPYLLYAIHYSVSTLIYWFDLSVIGSDEPKYLDVYFNVNICYHTCFATLF